MGPAEATPPRTVESTSRRRPACPAEPPSQDGSSPAKTGRPGPSEGCFSDANLSVSGRLHLPEARRGPARPQQAPRTAGPARRRVASAGVCPGHSSRHDSKPCRLSVRPPLAATVEADGGGRAPPGVPVPSRRSKSLPGQPGPAAVPAGALFGPRLGRPPANGRRRPVELPRPEGRREKRAQRARTEKRGPEARPKTPRRRAVPAL